MLKKYFLVTGVFCLLFAVCISQGDVIDKDNSFGGLIVD
jgi:hypothetical protein